MATKETTVIKKSSVTETGSNSAGIIDVIKVYGNSNTVKARKGNDQITVYKGKNHKIYGDDGIDTITAAKTAGTGSKLYGGAGNDNIKIKGGSKIYAYGEGGNDKITVSGGNKHVLSGGTGSDTYTFSAAMKKATRLTVNQAGKASGDEDILRLTKVNKGDVSFSYNSSKKMLTAAHKTGGKVYVKNWPANPLAEVQFADKESVHVFAGSNKKKLSGTSGNDYILAESANKTVKAGAGKDTVIVSAGSGSKVNGGSGADTIRIKSGSGFEINSGTGNDKVYVDGGSVKGIVNSGGTDYIEIGKSAGNGIIVESVGGGSVGYKLVANETVKVLGGNNHDIRLYGGNDKVIVAGGSGHVIYTDGPTGSGDGGGNDTIVIQNGGTVKKIVAGNGDDVIAVANGAGNGSKIYTGLEDPNGKSSGTGHNKLNLLGGSGHTVYLGGSKNTVVVEAQNITLNKYAGTDDDITVRWSEEGTGTLRINCPNQGSGEHNSMLRLEGVNSVDFSYEISNDLQVNTGNSYDGYALNSLVMKFKGYYFRDVDGYNGSNVYQVGDDYGNTRVPVYINNNSGLIQYNWCAGNQPINYQSTPLAAADMPAATIEIARWGSFKAFVGITFDDRFVSFADINTVASSSSHIFPSKG